MIVGHDSIPLDTVLPTVTVLVPSVEGPSHNQRELTSHEDVVRGVDVLARVCARVIEGALIGC